MKFSKAVSATIFLIMMTTACGSKNDATTPVQGGGAATGGGSSTQIFGTPTGFNVSPRDHAAYIQFVRNSAAANYKIYFGTTSAMTGLGSNYQASPITTNGNLINFGNLTNGTTYYFAISAVKSTGEESAKTATKTVIPAVQTAQ